MTKRGGDRFERSYDPWFNELIVPPGVREPSDGEAVEGPGYDDDRRCVACGYRGVFCKTHGATA